MPAAEHMIHSSPARADASRCTPFVRLRELLGDAEPGQPAISLAVGEPQHAVPSFVGPVVAAHLGEFGRYPMNKELDEFCEAAAGWLGRRFALPRPVDPAREVLVLNGSREGLFMAAIAASRWASGRRGRPAMLIPNPFYAAYAAGAVAANCEPVYLPATAATGFLPDLDALSEELLARTVAYFIASPANPQGAVADRTYLARIVGLAEEVRLPGVQRRMLLRDLHRARTGRHARSCRAGLCQRGRVPVALQALEPAGAAHSIRRRGSQVPGAVPGAAQCRGAAGTDADAARGDRRLRRRGPCRREPGIVRAEIRPRRPDHRQPLRLPKAGRADSSCGSTSRRRAATKPSPSGSGGRRGCASCPDAISRAIRTTAPILVFGYIRVAMVQDQATTAEALHRLVAVLG